MRTSKLVSVVITLIAFLAIDSVVVNVPAQQPKPIPLPKRCKATADQIYFVDSGQMVKEVHPGSNGGNGYQLNILGSKVDKFTLMKEPYMKSVSLVFANDTQAKWQIYFEPNMGRTIGSVRMAAYECTGRAVHEHRLTESVQLLDQ